MFHHSHQHPAQTSGRLIRWASFYDGLVNIMTLGHIRRLRTLTVENALLKPGESILDVGCGTGAVAIPAGIRVGKTGHAAGIDPSPEMIAVAAKKALHAGLEVDFRVGVIESLPYPDSSFDAVTSSLMMHHLPQDAQVKGISEIYRVLKPGGRLLIADMMNPNVSASRRFFTSLAMHHALQSGVEDLMKPLEDAGFKEVQQLDDHFLTIGFVRATKPVASIRNKE